MKILIVCVPRTGSNSFIKALSKTLNIPHVSVPDSFNYKNNSSLINSILAKDKVIFRISPIHYVGYDMSTFLSFFDKVILLSRLNDEEHYKSIVNLYYREHIMKGGTNSSYIYDDIPKSIIKKIEKVLNWEEILEQKQEIIKLSSARKESILYYEDIYFSHFGLKYLEEKFINLDTSLFTAHLSNTKKLSTTRDRSII